MASWRSCWRRALSVVSVMPPVSHPGSTGFPAARRGAGTAADSADDLRLCDDGPMHPVTRTALRTAGGVVGAGVAGVAYAALVERTWFTLRRFAVPVLPPGSAPVRVLQVSDLHLTPGQSKKIQWVRDLAALRPDFVVNSGDNLAHLQAVPPLLRAMEPLMELPRRLRPGVQRLLRADPEEPGPLPHPGPRRGPVAAHPPARRRARLRDDGRGLARPRQHADDRDDGRPPRRARRRRRPAHPARPLRRRRGPRPPRTSP